MDLTDSLGQAPVFSHLDANEMKMLGDAALVRTYRKGEWIVYQGDVWPYLYYVSSGEINAIMESPEGRSLIAATMKQGEIFWGLAFFIDDAPMPAALCASKDSELYLWSREGILPLLLENGIASWELSRLVVQKMLRASKVVESLAFQPTAGRLAHLLLQNYQGAVDEYVSRDMTLDEMGARIGTTREVVCRLLSHFAEQGAVEIKRTEFKIADRDKLAEYARRVKGE